MGIASVTTGRILKGQEQNKSGEEVSLAMDQFDHVGFSKVSKALNMLAHLKRSFVPNSFEPVAVKNCNEF